MNTKKTSTKTMPLYLRPSFVVVVLLAICGYTIFFNDNITLLTLAPYLAGGLFLWVLALGINYNKRMAEDDDDS